MSDLGDLLSLEYGEPLPSEIRTGHGYPVFGSNGEVGRHDSVLIEGPGIIVGRKGSAGKVCWTDESFWPIDTTYWVKCESDDQRWLYWLLSYLPLSRLGSSTGVPGLNRNDVYTLQVFGPPGNERRKIAMVLDALETTIRQTEAIIEKLKQVKQGLLHDLLTRGIDANGELRPPQSQTPHLYKNSPLGWIPNDWRSGQIEEFVDRIIDYRGKTPVKCASGIPLITAKNVRLGYVDTEPQEFISERTYDEWMTRGIPQQGDVLFTMEAPLGNVAQIESDERLAFAQRMIILQSGQSTINTFLKYLLLGEPFRRRLFRMGSGSTVEGIQQSTFRKLAIAVPISMTEQREIVRILDESSSVIDSEASTLSKLKKTKSGLMDDLLTGRVRIAPILETAGS
ncbi:restriction endonuclease subunit S [Pseudoduganella albidiflava]|uniref:Restriction endonuclease subunit S n=1 Tax=Pseudoduganella albidiflava TaxID=321983 RepID=A0A411X538_9BURK|nr:restriction endonuclease subunit S [Pseudoduganella albidiflava]QBI04139.1 restriction endonuclease subunit S [Pseudoduganella albidiflava]GGY24985.1 hypothetical protein GCM10007387_03220 [Pseudoduganella albidiflava]